MWYKGLVEKSQEIQVKIQIRLDRRESHLVKRSEDMVCLESIPQNLRNLKCL